MKIASQEIRTLAIKAYDSGVPPQQIAETLGYHLNSINRWLRVYQTEGRVKALPRGHRISMFSAEERKQLVELLEKRPDITLDEIRMHFGKQCSLNAVHKIVKALERFNFEKGETRGGGTAPPGPKRAEKPRFFRETTGRIV